VPGSDSVFVCGSKSLLKEFSISSGKLIKDYKSNYTGKYRTGQADISTITITPNGKYL
jgi:hypothetical protein